MRTILREVYPGIYAFDMLTPEFCDALLDEIEYFENWCVRRGLKVQRPNTYVHDSSQYRNELTAFGAAA